MEVGQLCSILEACLSSNQAQRAAAEETLKQFQYTRGQPVNLLRIIVEPSVKLEVRQFASIFFKNLIKGSWEDKDDPRSPLHGEDKSAVRDNILEGLIRSPPVIRSQLAECVKAIVYSDFPEKWPNILDQAVSNLSTQDESRLNGCLLALRILTRRFEFRSGAERESMDRITNLAFPSLLQIVESLLASNATSPAAGELLKLSLKVLWSSIYMDVPSIVVNQFSRWMNIIHILISRPVPQEGQPEDVEERKLWVWWKVRKWALNLACHCFQRRGSEITRKQKEDSREAKFGELWRKECSTQFLNDYLALASRLVSGEYMTPRVVNLILKYLTHAISVPQTWKNVKPHIETLLTKFVFPLMCFTDEDDELWNEDPQEYIRQGYDFLDELYSPKNAATQFASELMRSRPKGNSDSFLTYVVQIMNEYQAFSGPTPEQARKMDGAFLAIGSLSDSLKNKKSYRTQLETMLLQFVLPAFSSPYGHLRSKACWLSGQFADIDFREGSGQGSTFQTLFAQTVKALQDPDLPVRVDAVVALRQIVDAYSEDHLDEMKPHLPVLLDQLFKLMAEVDHEDMVLTLEGIVEKFGEEMAPYALGLCQHLTQAFWRLLAAEAEDDRDEDEASLAAFGCLRALSTVLESVSGLPEIFPTLQPIIVPIIRKMCSQDGQDVMEEIMEILSYFTYFSPQITPELWELWPLLHQAYNEWASDYFENILVPLDNYISRGTEVFLTSQNPPYLQQAVQMAEKSIQDPEASEGDVVCAPKLLEIMLQACRGRIDQYVPHFISLATKRLQTAKRINLRVQLVNVVANAIYYNPSLTLHALHQQGSLATFLPLWFRMIFEQRPDGRRKFFRRQHDKKVGSLSLTALLLAPDDALPQELKAGLNQVLLASIRLLQDLKKQQDDFTVEEADSDEDIEGNDEDDEEDDEEIDEKNEAEDDAYMARLSREAAKLAGTSGGSDSDDDWTDDEEEATPLDHINPFISFTNAMTTLQASQPDRFRSCTTGIDAQNQAALQMIAKTAQEEQGKLGTKK